MPLEISYITGNNYIIHDSFVTADVEILGGGGGMAIILKAIKPVEPIMTGVDTSEDVLISHLGKGLVELKRFRSFLISYKGIVVASTDADAPTGSRIPSQITWHPKI